MKLKDYYVEYKLKENESFSPNYFLTLKIKLNFYFVALEY